MAAPTHTPARAVVSSAFGRRALKIDDGSLVSAIARAAPTEIVKGTDGTRAKLPGMVHSVIGGFASVAGAFFWGFSDTVNEDVSARDTAYVNNDAGRLSGTACPAVTTDSRSRKRSIASRVRTHLQHHMDRAAWTIERLTVPLARRGDVVETAHAFVEAFRAGRTMDAQLIWVEAFFTRLRPDFRATPELIAHMRTFHAYTLPGPNWLLPWSSCSFASAKAALARAFGTDDLEFIHHTFAVYGTYVDAVVPALTQREAEISAAQASGGMPVLTLFDRVAVSTFRVGATTTTLGGALDASTRVEPGTLIDLQLAKQPLREHRFMSCCGQNLVSELTREIVDQYYDRRYVILACRAPVPVEARVIPQRLRAAQEAGRWNVPDADRYTPAAPSVVGSDAAEEDDAPVMAAADAQVQPEAVTAAV